MNEIRRIKYKYIIGYDAKTKTLIIDKPIPVKDFIKVKEYYKKKYKIKEIFVNWKIVKFKY